VGGGHQRGVVVPPEPGAAFVVVEPELAFELFVVELHLPAHACQPCQPLGLGVGGQVCDPVVGRLLLPVRPFGDQPFLARRHLRTFAPPTPAIVIAPAVGSVNPGEDEPGGDRFAVGAVAEGDRLRTIGPEPADQLADRYGLAVRPRPARPASRALLLGRHREGGALLAHLRLRPDRQHVHPAWSRRSRNQVFSP